MKIVDFAILLALGLVCIALNPKLIWLITCLIFVILILNATNKMEE
jgi:hypothetical protein